MTGPEHYREAERLLAEGLHVLGEDGPLTGAAEPLAAAQVHATLALAAATAMAHPYRSGERIGMSLEDFRAWDKACGVEP